MSLGSLVAAVLFSAELNKMFSYLALLSALFLGVSNATTHESRAGSNAYVFPTINMTDTSGNAIQAHGGDIIQDSGYFYWFGEDKSGETTSGHFQAVNCYRSSDFASWEYRGAVLSPIAGTNISNTSIVERPKVLYNDANDEYVMWFHNDNSDYGLAMVGVATSKTIDGTYNWTGSFKPFGTDSRDMTVWKDDNGTAYLIFASDDNADFKVASLTDDYYNVSTMEYQWDDVYWEAPGVFKIDDSYYLLYSRQDGWTPTDNYYMKASSMAGPWADPILLAQEGYYAYNTQNAYDIVINGTEGTLYLYYGDHWNAPNLGASTYSFYPVAYSDGNLTLSYSTGYTIDVSAGTWQNLSYSTITAADSTVSPTGALETCTSCSSGSLVNLTESASMSFTWNGTAGTKVLSIKYAYDAGKQVWQDIGVTIDGNNTGSALLESTRSSDVYLDAPIQADLVTGSVVNLTSTGTDGNGVLYVASVAVFDRG